MLHRQRIRASLFVTSLAWATFVWAGDARLWSEGNDYVRLEPASAANQHPVAFSAEQLTAILGRFYKREGNKEPVPYFSQDEISRIAPDLVRLFAKAKVSDDIEFGTSFRPGNFFLVPRKLNSGRLFIENSQLNLLIGMCAADQDVSYQQIFGKYPDLDHGNRAKSVAKLGCELLAGNDAERVDNRSDWLRLDINAALAARSVPTFLPATKALTFGAMAVTPAPAASPAQAQTPAAVTRPVEPALPAPPVSDAEERLILLKRLHDKGLITDTEYEQKRTAVLKAL
jgi:hypothetical protein